jgi:hypothetical protein
VFTEEGACCCAVSSFALVASNATKMEALKRSRINIYLVLSLSHLYPFPEPLPFFLSNSSALEYETGRGAETKRNNGCRHPLSLGASSSAVSTFNSTTICEVTNHKKRSIRAAANPPALWCKPMQTHLCKVCCCTAPCRRQSTSAHFSNYAKFRNNMSCFYRNENAAKTENVLVQ